MTAASPHDLATHRQPGRHSNIFQPPQSPAYSASNSHDYFSPSHRTSRKRARPESVDWTGGLRTPTVEATTPGAQSWIQCPTPSDGIYGSAGAVGSGMVNERYRLRDGLDTPGFMAGMGECAGAGWDMDGRGSRWEDREVGRASDARMLNGPLARERNGVARTRSSPQMPTQAQQGWAGFAFGLVGRVFSFGSGVFRGFYAGGGQGYDVNNTPAPVSHKPRRPRISRAATPVPGAWQDDDFLGDFEQDNLSSPQTLSTRPPNKRRQTDRDSWVVVGTPDLSDSGGGATSPKRKLSSNSVPRGSLAANTRPSASRAASRRSIAPMPTRRQSSYTTSVTGSPAVHQASTHMRVNSDTTTRPASFAPMRTASRPSSAHSHGHEVAYISPEAERFARRQAKQDRAADKAMSSMSKQLRDLIRQGQQALGTRVDVDENDDDEGGGAAEGMEVDEGFVDEDEGMVWK